MSLQVLLDRVLTTIYFDKFLRVKEFSIPRFNSITYGKHSLRYLGPVLWAKIPSNIRQSLTLKVFKKAVRGLDLGALVNGEGCEGCSVCST